MECTQTLDSQLNQLNAGGSNIVPQNELQDTHESYKRK